RARTEAGVLDPGGGVAARRARAVRTRDAGAGDTAEAGISAAGGGHGGARPARVGSRGPLAAGVGAARIHALARAARRGDQARRRARTGSRRVRVWIDMTASAHPLVFRPLVGLLEARGDEVEITAREYAQTLQLI